MNRLLEILICLLLGLLALPFFVIACVVVLLSIGRPLMFSQIRAGRQGHNFRLYKLRSMKETRAVDGSLHPDADRQTRATAMIRRLRLDEIPQLLLILQNKMALVGPRPLLPETIEDFGPAGQYRCSVRPGLTGWAQVSGNTNLSNSEKLSLDLWYVAHRSLALDLQILGETVGAALHNEPRRDDRIEAARKWMDSNGPLAQDMQEMNA
ncbi:sugar transferase [Ruegeria arenilitoris]|uniref:sugar transferase n=1 Tax=Ruegeria arenilitoris TaxID=1173585 RepID=UPI001C2C9875